MQRGLRGTGTPRARSRGFPNKAPARPPAALPPAAGSASRAATRAAATVAPRTRAATPHRRCNKSPRRALVPPRPSRAAGELPPQPPPPPQAPPRSGIPRPRPAAPALPSGADPTPAPTDSRPRSPRLGAPRGCGAGPGLRGGRARRLHLTCGSASPESVGRRRGTGPRGRAPGAALSARRGAGRCVPPPTPLRSCPLAAGQEALRVRRGMLAAPLRTRRRARRPLTAPQYGGGRRRSDFPPLSDAAPAPALGMRGGAGPAREAARSRCP